MADLLQPTEITITDINDQEHRYNIGKVPYMAGGRELAVDYLASAKRGNYKRNQELAAMMFKHIEAITPDGDHIRLTTSALVDNHVPDIPTGLKLELAIAEHNLGFSIAGKIRVFQQEWKRNTEQFNSTISTLLQAVSRLPMFAPSQNSEPSTAQRTHS